MTSLRHYPDFHSVAVHGAAPAYWYGIDPIAGDTGNWVDAPIGAVYERNVAGQGLLRYRKVLDSGSTGDWVLVGGALAQRISVEDFADGEADEGTLVLDLTIPAGATVTRCLVRDVVGFAGDTSATMVIGDGDDDDRYMTDTLDVFASAEHVDAGEVSGARFHDESVDTITVTVTTDSAFEDCQLEGVGRATIVILFE